MRNDQIALQLYTVRELLARDLPGTLRQVADAGYRHVELAGIPPTSSVELRDLLGAAGLAPVAAHQSLEVLRRDAPGVIDGMVTAGCPRIIVPWLMPEDRATPERVREVARELGRIGALCRERGLRFGYHNHAFEFDPLGGTTTWNVLLEELPAEVDIELDVYWAAVAGRDPAQLIRDLAGRVRLLHMKDMGAGPDGGDVAPGDGILPWPDIIDAGRSGGVEWYIVEQDEPRDTLAEISRGLQHLGSLAEPGAQPGGAIARSRAAIASPSASV
jgi:sugar phosphate isomerase/epimerase